MRSIALRGPVHWRVDRTGPLCLTLSGSSGAELDPTTVGFSGLPPEPFPNPLPDVEIERLDEQTCRLKSSVGSWVIDATTVHVHRDVSARFYRALPPRRAPWTKRLFWSLVLGLMQYRSGRQLLLWLRRH